MKKLARFSRDIEPVMYKQPKIANLRTVSEQGYIITMTTPSVLAKKAHRYEQSISEFSLVRPCS